MQNARMRYSKWPGNSARTSKMSHLTVAIKSKRNCKKSLEASSSLAKWQTRFALKLHLLLLSMQFLSATLLERLLWSTGEHTLTHTWTHTRIFDMQQDF